MATCQFLRDFRRAYNLKKTAEHRKRVLQRKQVAAQCNDHPKFVDIMEDRSAGKQISHNHLYSFFQWMQCLPVTAMATYPTHIT